MVLEATGEKINKIVQSISKNTKKIITLIRALEINYVGLRRHNYGINNNLL